MYDFDKAIDRRGTTSIKWNKQYAFGQKDGLLPFWIADTDFASVPEILDAIRNAVTIRSSDTASRWTVCIRQSRDGGSAAISGGRTRTGCC